MKVRALYLGVLFTLGLFGCAAKITPESLRLEQSKQIVAAGHSLAFADGYIDGCISGKNFINDQKQAHKKDATRYLTERDYNSGWEKGYYACREEAIQQMQQATKQEYIPTANASEEQERKKIWDDVSK